MIKVFQAHLTDEMANEVNGPGGGWENVAWGKTYLDLTMGMFSDGDNVSVMEMVLEAIDFGLIKHTMTIDTDDVDAAFALGNGMGDMSKVEEHCDHKSASVGDVFINTDTNEGVVIASFGFEALTRDEVDEIKTAYFTGRV